MEELTRLNIKAFISGFSCKEGPVKIDDNLILRKVLPAELIILKQSALDSDSIDQFDMLHVNNILEFKHEIQKGQVIDIPKNIVHNFITVLRLNKKGSVGCPLIMADFLEGSYPGAKHFRYFRKPRREGDYKLESEEIDKIIIMLNQFKKLDFVKYKFLDMVIRRFNYAYERDRAQDKLIDYMISFESLLLTESEKGELSFRLALRTAFLLEEEKNNREEIFKNIKDAYKVRNELVHGKHEDKINISLNKKYDMDINLFASKIEEELRKSIKNILYKINNYDNQKEFIEELDKKILT